MMQEQHAGLRAPFASRYRDRPPRIPAIGTGIAIAFGLVVTLTGCVAGTHATSPTPTRTSSPVTVQRDTGYANTCTVASIVESNAHNAYVLRHQGTINDREFDAMIEPMVVDLNVLRFRNHSAFKKDLARLRASIPDNGLGGTDKSFDPSSTAYYKAIAALRADCKRVGFDMLPVDATGGG